MTISPQNSDLIMRHIYFDEAGIGNPNIEPYTVVAGIVLHVDNQYDSLQKYLLEMANDLVAQSNKRPLEFVFHAKELWHGNGFFPRDDWTLEKRLEILGHLADIPENFNLPIIYSCIKREEYVPKDLKGKQRAAADKKCHATCFMSCLSQADRWIEQFYPDEKVFAIVEHHQSHKSGLQIVADYLTNPRLIEEIQNDNSLHCDPIKHFVETPLFSPKSGNSPLQIADICAFILSRALAEAKHSDVLLEKIRPQLASGFIKSFFQNGSPGEPESF